MWEPTNLTGSEQPEAKQVQFFELDNEYGSGDTGATGNNYGTGSATGFGLELEIGTGNIKLNCRESTYGQGPIINLDIINFTLFFAAKYLRKLINIYFKLLFN